MPSTSNVSLQVYCNLTDGGWTYIQHRFDGRLLFNKTMQEYIDGFGDLKSEFWLGLDKIHALTLHPRKVKLEVLTIAGDWKSASYSTFSVGGPTAYTLRISRSMSGGDLHSLTLSDGNGRPFTRGCPRSTVTNTLKYQYGWWFRHCAYTFINGIYGLDRDFQQGFNVYNGSHLNLRTSILKIQ